MPQGKYMPEGLFDSQLLASYINSEAGMMKAMETGAILQGTVTRCDSRHNLYCDVGAFKGIIPRNEAVFDTASPSKEIALTLLKFFKIIPSLVLNFKVSSFTLCHTRPPDTETVAEYSTLLVK